MFTMYASHVIVTVEKKMKLSTDSLPFYHGKKAKKHCSVSQSDIRAASADFPINLVVLISLHLITTIECFVMFAAFRSPSSLDEDMSHLHNPFSPSLSPCWPSVTKTWMVSLNNPFSFLSCVLLCHSELCSTYILNNFKN